MKISIHGGKSVLEVAESTFGANFNEALIHQVVTAHRAHARSGTKKQKNRSDARGGGEKPWRQKGTGRARAGTIRSPIWVGGGRAFAARPRDYEQKVNRKMYSAAMRSILSELLRQERLLVVDDFVCEEAKTREWSRRSSRPSVSTAPWWWWTSTTPTPVSRHRNIPGVDILDLREVDPVSLIRFPAVVATTAAVKGLEERLS